MRRITALVMLAAVTTWIVGLAGCSSSTPDAAPPAAQSDDGGGGSADGGSADGATDMEKMKAELAKLSPEDAASAQKQHMCPVSGKMLGTMGPPQKVDVNGQPVWICCEGCKEDLLANPDEYLAKLKKD